MENITVHHVEKTEYNNYNVDFTIGTSEEIKTAVVTAEQMRNHLASCGVEDIDWHIEYYNNSTEMEKDLAEIICFMEYNNQLDADLMQTAAKKANYPSVFSNL